jgi:hypothetical protein
MVVDIDHYSVVRPGLLLLCRFVLGCEKQKPEDDELAEKLVDPDETPPDTPPRQFSNSAHGEDSFVGNENDAQCLAQNDSNIWEEEESVNDVQEENRSGHDGDTQPEWEDESDEDNDTDNIQPYPVHPTPMSAAHGSEGDRAHASANSAAEYENEDEVEFESEDDEDEQNENPMPRASYGSHPPVSRNKDSLFSAPIDETAEEDGEDVTPSDLYQSGFSAQEQREESNNDLSAWSNDAHGTDDNSLSMPQECFRLLDS